MTKLYQASRPAQAIPLQPRPENPMQAVWRRIRDNGYDVIPLRGRDGPFKGWPKAANTDQAIALWSGRAAGIRMYNSRAFVIDLDVRTVDVRDALLAMLWAKWPEFMDKCLWRTSGSTTLALIGQVSTVRTRKWTARFKAGEGQPPHLVEYFTGCDKRYVAVYGNHSPGREYGYIGPSILEVKREDLPLFPETDIPVMIDEAERVMRGLGLEQIIVAQPHMPGERVYDLKPDDVMMLADGERITLRELEKRAGPTRIKGFANIWDPGSKTPDRVLVNRSGAMGLTLWDTKHSVSHRWAALSPAEDVELRRMLNSIKHPWED